MKNTNSPLVSVQILSPFKTNHEQRKIDTITIHHMAGNLTVESCGKLFQQKGKRASSNYGIGSDGRIAMYVEEKNASWCSSSTANDSRAITIEVANCTGKEDGWRISDKAMKSLINLIADVCTRNGIKQLLWENNPALIGKVDRQNITLHRWFKDKDCPGAYIEANMNNIVKSVNDKLIPPLYRVQVGAFRKKENAIALVAKLKEIGIEAIIKEE